MAIEFITLRTLGLLKKANFVKLPYKVPNNHKALDSEQTDLWVVLAEAFDIDLADTGYTIKAQNDKKGNLAFYAPYIGSTGDQAVLVWGRVKKPLSELDTSKVTLSIVGTKLEIYVNSLEDSLFLHIMTSSGKDEDATKDQKEYAKSTPEQKTNLLRKAWRSGNLHIYMSETQDWAKALKEVAGMTLTVIGYRIDPTYGKYEVKTQEEGWVKTNTQVSRVLDRNPLISEEYYALMTVSAEPVKYFDKEKKKPIYNVELQTYEARELPVFDFGEPDDSNVDPELTFA